MFLFVFLFIYFSYPREKDQGVAFEKKIAPADLVVFFDCADVSCILQKIQWLMSKFGVCVRVFFLPFK